MGLETGTYISDLVAANPTGSDGKDKGDDHIRLVKSTIKATFPNVNGAVNPTPTEFNYVVGVTSAIQTQFGNKGTVAGQVWTGTHDYTAATATFATQTAGDSTTKAATTAFTTTAVANATLAAITSTSTTSLLISNVSKSLTTQTGKAYTAGYNFISLVSNANPANYMIGTLTSYNSGTGAMVVNVTTSGGSGTYTDWNIAISGAPGAAGIVAATTQQTLTDAATVAWDWNSGRIGKVTIAGNRIIGLPTNLTTDTFFLYITQDATGSRVPTWNAAYKWSSGVVQNPDPAANRTSIYTGIYDGTSIHIGQFSYGSR